MKAYTKILITTLPLVFFFLTATVGITYYFSRIALTDLAGEWLSTRSSEAMVIAEKHESILHKYGLEYIPASIVKAKLDAIQEISTITIGKKGYLFGIDIHGTIVFHPNEKMVGQNFGSEPWFKGMGETKNRIFLTFQNEKSVAIYDFFPKWNWFILAVDPKKEVYGMADRMKPYLFSVGISAALIISFALMLLTRHLMRPLQSLVKGAEQIGNGDLETQISVHTQDEFANLAREFNRMTDRLNQTLTELQHREEYFRSLIENATDIITIADSKGRFIYSSPSTKRILGYDLDDLAEKSMFDYIHPDETDIIRDQFKKRVRGKINTKITEFRFKHRDGYWCTMESISKNLLSHTGIKGFVINSRDISKRKLVEAALKKSYEELEQRVALRTRELHLLNQTLNKEIGKRKIKEAELEKANLAKTEFLANVGHEIRTPLNSVIGFSEILSKMVNGTQEKSYINAIKIAGTNLLSIINNILDLSKMEVGKFKLSKVSVNVHLLLDNIYQLYRTRIDEKSLDFIMDIDPRLPAALFMDDIRVQQIVINLMDNAVKFTRKGHIRLWVQTTNSDKKSNRIDLSIFVEDTGIGIPKDKLNRIFDSFEQVSSTVTREYGGTGLGLSICRHLATLMGGSIQVKSREAEGSVFQLVLPGIEIDPDQVPERKNKAEIQKRSQRYSPPLSKMPGTERDKKLPASFLSAEWLENTCTDKPGLKKQIHTDIFQCIPGFKEGVKIGDIQIVIEHIRHIGETFHIPEFTQLSRELNGYAQSFDIKKLESCLGHLHTTLKTTR